MSPLEVAQLYQTFASDGFFVPQRAISSVLAPDHKVLKRYGLAVEQRFNPQQIFLINTALQKVVSDGTGASLARYLPTSLLVAGKTGTSDDLRDSWFAGFTGNHLAVVWLGLDDNKPTGLTGSSGALVVWGRVMAELDTAPLVLGEPPGLTWSRVDLGDYGDGSRYKDKSELLPFVAGSSPPGSVPQASPGLRTGLLDRLRNWFSR